MLDILRYYTAFLKVKLKYYIMETIPPEVNFECLYYRNKLFKQNGWYFWKYVQTIRNNGIPNKTIGNY